MPEKSGVSGGSAEKWLRTTPHCTDGAGGTPAIFFFAVWRPFLRPIQIAGQTSERARFGKIGKTMGRGSVSLRFENLRRRHARVLCATWRSLWGASGGQFYRLGALFRVSEALAGTLRGAGRRQGRLLGPAPSNYRRPRAYILGSFWGHVRMKCRCFCRPRCRRRFGSILGSIWEAFF